MTKFFVEKSNFRKRRKFQSKKYSRSSRIFSFFQKPKSVPKFRNRNKRLKAEMPIIGPDFTVDLAVDTYSAMEKSIATQIAEASLMSWVIDNSEGIVTVIRALSQKDSTEDRLRCFNFFANDCWYAINQPGKEEDSTKWLNRLKTRLLKAFFNAYHRQICAAGILERDVSVKVRVETE